MERLDPERIREKLAQKTGREYWRSLDELAGSEDFFSFLKAEFPRQAEILEHVGGSALRGGGAVAMLDDLHARRSCGHGTHRG